MYASSVWRYLCFHTTWSLNRNQLLPPVMLMTLSSCADFSTWNVQEYKRVKTPLTSITSKCPHFPIISQPLFPSLHPYLYMIITKSHTCHLISNTLNCKSWKKDALLHNCDIIIMPTKVNSYSLIWSTWSIFKVSQLSLAKLLELIFFPKSISNHIHSLHLIDMSFSPSPSHPAP